MAATVEEYLAELPADVRARVEELRRVVAEVAPGAGEAISYAMPVFTLDGAPLLHAGAWKQHIGLYPVPVFDGALEAEVAPLRSGRDTMKLPHGAPFPRDLVTRVVQALVDRRG
ncbi:iron chaperone [Modestobacter sp. SSW1-42]|uniref:iron chaperone n=1 Tax=Modestobacter sp. SSW1-42 TaxID=596372 RepID=UPI0039875B09